MDIKFISSLEKCFIEDSLDKFNEYKQATIFKNEKFNFIGIKFGFWNIGQKM